MTDQLAQDARAQQTVHDTPYLQRMASTRWPWFFVGLAAVEAVGAALLWVFRGPNANVAGLSVASGLLVILAALELSVGVYSLGHRDRVAQLNNARWHNWYATAQRHPRATLILSPIIGLVYGLARGFSVNHHVSWTGRLVAGGVGLVVGAGFGTFRVLHAKRALAEHSIS